jgi:hypothetical protein
LKPGKDQDLQNEITQSVSRRSLPSSWSIGLQTSLVGFCVVSVISFESYLKWMQWLLYLHPHPKIKAHQNRTFWATKWINIIKHQWYWYRLAVVCRLFQYFRALYHTENNEKIHLSIHESAINKINGKLYANQLLLDEQR